MDLRRAALGAALLLLATCALPVASAATEKLPVCLTTSSSPQGCHDDGYNVCTKYLPDHNPVWICRDTTTTTG